MHSPTLARVLPFAAFMLFIALPETLGFLSQSLVPSPETMQFFYPLQIGIPLLLMIVFRKQYVELSLSELGKFAHTALSITTGIVVYILWIHMDWALFSSTPSPGFRPHLFENPSTRVTMTAIRVFGAAIVVPLFEELFWRSFLTRYLAGRDFMTVPQGTFTVFSFAATALLFGLEHTYLIAGIMAGTAYNLLYRQTRSTTQCVLSHAVTNGLLCLHVLTTEEWHYW